MCIARDKRRLVLEYAAMRERWGDTARLCANHNATELWWEYVLQHGGGNRMPIRVVYPEGYPSMPPVLKVMCDMPCGTPHLMAGNEICWLPHGGTNRARNRWDPACDTAAVALGAAHRWYLAFLVWVTTGSWPESMEKCA